MQHGYPEQAIRVVVVDDHPAIIAGLAVILKQAPEVEIVGATGDGREALALVEQLRPDVVILDLALPGLSGLAVAERVRSACPEVAVLVFTAFDDLDARYRLRKLGALGYVMKGVANGEVIAAVRAVAVGQVAYAGLPAQVALA